MEFNNPYYANQFLKKAEQLGFIHTTKWEFGEIYLSLTFEIISVEIFVWVLKSLEKDEMTPNEKAIQSRIKEAFSYKINNIIWEKLLD